MASDSSNESWAQTVVAGLYDHLLLRDVMGKVVPGALVVMLAFLWSSSVREWPSEIPQWPKLSWVAVLLLSWTVAFALQSAGRSLGLLVFMFHGRVLPRPGYIKWIAGNGFGSLNLAEDKSTWAAADQRLRKTCRDKESTKDARQKERSVVIKEACGNTAMAGLLLALHELWLGEAVAALVLAVVSVLLIGQHYSALRQEYALMAEVEARAEPVAACLPGTEQVTEPRGAPARRG